jgi:hypothetical protein
VAGLRPQQQSAAADNRDNSSAVAQLSDHLSTLNFDTSGHSGGNSGGQNPSD